MRATFWVLLLLALISIASHCSQEASAAADAWRFAVLCDTRGDNEPTLRKTCINDAVVEAIAHDIVAEKCKIVLVPGDLVNGWWASGGTDYAEQFQNWKTAMEPVYSADISVYPVRGNHENCSREPYPPPDPELLEAYLGAFSGNVPLNGPEREESLTYFVEYKNALFIGLDQYITPHRVNQDWLDEVLHDHLDNLPDGDTPPFVFVYGHEPAYRVCHEDCLAIYSAERNVFWRTLEENGVLAYFCGHDHLTYAQASSGDTPPHQIVVGGGGAPFVPNKSFYDPDVCPLAPELGLHYANNTNYAYVIVTVTDMQVDAVLRLWSGPLVRTWTDVPLFTYGRP